MIKGIFGKLILMNLIVISVTLLVIAFLHSQLISAYIFEQKEKELQSKGREMSALLIDHMEGNIDEDTTLYLLSALDGFLDARIWMVDRDGLVVMTSYGSRQFRRGPGFRIPDREDAVKIMEGETVVRKRYMHHFDETMLTVGVPIKKNEGSDNVEGALLLHAPVTGISATVSRLRQLTWLAGLVALIFALVIGYIYSRRFSVPLSKMSDSALKMAGGDFSAPVDITSDDEIGKLGKSLNYLSGRLDKTINELKQEKNKFVSMVTGMREGVMSVNHRGEIIFLNEAASVMLHTEEDLTGIYLQEAVPAPRIVEAFNKVLQSGEPEHLIVQEKTAVLSLHISPVSSESADNKQDAVALIQDISESEKLESMRKEFIANVSHELKTPLTTISGFTGSILDGTATTAEDKKRYLTIIAEESSRMNRLINNLLDLSRLESGKMNINKEPFSLKEVAEDVIARLQLLADKKEISIKTAFNEPLIVSADSERIEQVLYNLIENAIRYIPEKGEIYTGASLSDDKKRVEVYVKDNGPGIPEEDLPFIWDRFHRVEKSRSRREGGTGIGLSIVKQIIEAHDSEILAENSLSGGVTFTFYLYLL